MKWFAFFLMSWVVAATAAETTPIPELPGRWTVERARAYYDAESWLIGCNYMPATAINQIEMWQEASFDPATIERELGWAQSLGFNLLRVFLHDLVWHAEREGLYSRMDEFMRIAERHGMKILWVFFDDCHQPLGAMGPQPLPVVGYHNSGWLNSPTRDVAIAYEKGEVDAATVARLRGYIQETMRRFDGDPRVFAWELYNEPGRGLGDLSLREGQGEAGTFGDRSYQLHLDTWKWAREVAPSQPICSCAEGSVGPRNIELARRNSDIISFHSYSGPKALEKKVLEYVAAGRPTMCTEFMARPNSTFAGSLPILKEHRIAVVCWGLVAGKTNTIWPWSGREGKDVNLLREQGVVVREGEPFPEPELWFHDIFRMDGTPFDPAEVELIRAMTAQP